MKSILLITVGVIAGYVMTAPEDKVQPVETIKVEPKTVEEVRPRTAKEKCIVKGVAYFKEIGSYPYLSDGRNAVTVTTERCSRTTGAFG